MIDATLVTIHGLFSSPATWDRLVAVWRTDQDLQGLRIYSFGYQSPKKPRFPLSIGRIPDYDDIAQVLATEYTTVLKDVSKIAIVSHSQGGLILQRFLEWMLNQGRGRDLGRIRTVVMLACPNGGSEYLESARHGLGLGRHPQVGSLDVLDRRIADTHRRVLDDIVRADGIGDHQSRIPVHAYAGSSDNIVKPASAQGAFPGASTLAGDHFSILDPAATGNRTAESVKYHILTDLTEQPFAPAQIQRSAILNPNEHGKPEVDLSRTQGTQVGDHNVQYNIFSPQLANNVLQVAPSDRAGSSAVDGTVASSTLSSTAGTAQLRIVNVSDDTYQTEVIRRSHTIPVIVEAWAESGEPRGS
jgi:pimeloyl-ACP methyl ester carboxylesterase